MDTRCEELHPDISSACRRADSLLWDAYARSTDSQPDASSEGRLVFPRYRDPDEKKDGKKGDLRVSEQEARFAFVEALCQGPFRYSVETPTDKPYQFSGHKKLSAQTDLAVHDASGRCRICNVEFKEGGISPSKSCKDNFPIYKDMQKLLREPVWGLWFHLLESVNNSTIHNFLNVIAEKVGKVQCEFGKDDVETPGLTLHVCVLKHGFSLQKDVPLLPDAISNDAETLKRCLDVSRSELKEVQDEDLNGWELHRKSQV